MNDNARIRHSNRSRMDKISVSLGKEMTGWLRRAAAKKHSNVSQVIREYLSPVFEKRHDKYVKPDPVSHESAVFASSAS